MRRQAGVVLPLFAIRTRRDWGIGQLTDLPACAAWIRTAGQRLLQVLPPHTLAAGETSPYGALTAFGLDPIYADIEAIEDLDAAAIDEVLRDGRRPALEKLRASERVDYPGVRALKTRAFDVAFDRFHTREWLLDTPRARRFSEFMARERGWLDDLCLFEALRVTHGGWGWGTWAEDQRDRSPDGIAQARIAHAFDILKGAYVQWTLYGQWDDAHRKMRDLGVELMGDMPFIVGNESADVWSHASQFQLRLSLGAPPDDFSADGQDWGLPAYDWLAMESDDLAWVRMRARHAARMYDRFRMDHVVGYFRQWVRRRDGVDRGRFDPEGREAQQARGRRVLGAVIDELSRHGANKGESNGNTGENTGPNKGQNQGNLVDAPRAIAEDLGVIPPFVRDSLRDLGMPGYRILPWEKDGDVFRDPLAYPTGSVASWSTHDTAPIDAWWPELSEGDRARFAERAGVAPGPEDDAGRSLALIGDLYRAKSDLALVLVQELLGSKDRINTPATVGPENWSWRFPRPLEDLQGAPELLARFEALRTLAHESGR